MKPRGRQGQRRPADAVGAAVMVAKIATGEAEEATGKAPEQATGGKVSGKARASVFSPAERSEFARLAAQARWRKTRE